MTAGRGTPRELTAAAWAAFGPYGLPPAGQLLGTHADEEGEMPFLRAAFMRDGREHVSFDDMRNAHLVMHYLTPAALLHFIPRMIELALAEGEEGGDLENSLELAFSVWGTDSRDGAGRRQALEPLLTTEARQVLRDFFAYWRSKYGGGPPVQPWV